MLRGYYTAVSGMVTQEKNLNVYANNLANSTTVGFKRDGLVNGTFGEHIAVRMNAYQGQPATQIGPSVYMQTVDDEFTSFAQGTFEVTGSPYHMAIQGDGYFVIRNADGTEALTRNGQFALDDEGYLVLPGYGRVQGEGGDILLENHRFITAQDGMIYLAAEDGEEADEIDRLFIANPLGGVNDFKKGENEMFTALAGYEQVDPAEVPSVVRHQTLERSNVNVANEMSLIIATQRGLQSCSQIVKMYDEIADSANTRISRVQ
jgi:flagellar basal-body rod protein FlgG